MTTLSRKKLQFSRICDTLLVMTERLTYNERFIALTYPREDIGDMSISSLTQTFPGRDVFVTFPIFISVLAPVAIPALVIHSEGMAITGAVSDLSRGEILSAGKKLLCGQILAVIRVVSYVVNIILFMLAALVCWIPVHGKTIAVAIVTPALMIGTAQCHDFVTFNAFKLRETLQHVDAVSNHLDDMQ